ncbi:MAG: methyltransferase [Mesorhizobium sp.]|nr:methyltransferase [Mesorhizobium sp.]
MTTDDQTYAFKNALDAQRERLRTLETLFDQGTIRCLEARGVGPGWRCAELGAGGGSIAAWLCDRVGAEGSVLATDLDTTVLRELDRPRLEVRVHDLLTDDLPRSEFDLIHLRLVLGWLGDPSSVLPRLVSALRPGGWIVAEEIDFVSAVADPRMGAVASALFARAMLEHCAVLAAKHRFDPFYGRRVSGDLADAGLADVECEGRTTMWRGGEAGGRIWRLTLTQLREPIIAAGRMTAAEVDEAIALCDDPRLSALSPIVMGAWGRRAVR